MIIRFVDSSALGQSANGDYAISVSDNEVYENIGGVWDNSNGYFVSADTFNGCQDVDLRDIKFRIVENGLPLRDSQGDILEKNCSVDLYVQSSVYFPGDQYNRLFTLFTKALDAPPITYNINEEEYKENVIFTPPTLDKSSVMVFLMNELLNQFGIHSEEIKYRAGIAAIKHADLPFPTIYNDYLGN